MSSAIALSSLVGFLVYVSILYSRTDAATYTNIIQTKTGKVRGVEQVYQGLTVSAFLGIPYALAPTGLRRFRRPEPSFPWPGVLNATQYAAECMQEIDTMFPGHPGADMWNAKPDKLSEDCLYLNIWVPRRGNSVGTGSRLPVLLWIYGGGFSTGSTNLAIYSGLMLAAKHDVIIASMQYRLGVFGFFYNGDMDAPGSVGLLDQQMAIQWIYRNIDYFGGAKERITLFGESAGAASVSLHLLSKGSQQFFTNAVMQSSSALVPWGVKSDGFVYNRSRDIAKMANCLTSDIRLSSKPVEDTSYETPKAVGRKQIQLIDMDCMRLVESARLSSLQFAARSLGVGRGDRPRYFEAPLPIVVDGLFLRDTPQRLLAQGKMKKTSILIGTNDNEGYYFLLYGLPKIFPLNSQKWKAFNKESFARALSKSLFPNSPAILKDSIMFAYVQSQFGTDLNYRRLLDEIAGDYEFICPTVAFADSYAANNLSVYQYHFTHRSSRNPWPKWMGVLHGYEIEYVFGDPLKPHLNYTIPEQVLSSRMMEYWTNFARTGNPNVLSQSRRTDNIWPIYTSSGKKVLVLSADERLEVKMARRFRHCAFWNTYVPKVLGLADQMPRMS